MAAYTRSRAELNRQPPSISWELWLFSWLILALQARNARIARLEQLDRQKALELDRIRRERTHQERRAA